jgi:hypothetical protein
MTIHLKASSQRHLLLTCALTFVVVFAWLEWKENTALARAAADLTGVGGAFQRAQQSLDDGLDEFKKSLGQKVEEHARRKYEERKQREKESDE